MCPGERRTAQAGQQGRAPLGGAHETQEQAGSRFSPRSSEPRESLAKGICVPSATRTRWNDVRQRTQTPLSAVPTDALNADLPGAFRPGTGHLGTASCLLFPGGKATYKH